VMQLEGEVAALKGELEKCQKKSKRK
jgi:hypothetical protein